MQAPMTIKQYVSQMRKIPGGRFTMGRTYDIEYPDSYKNEVPAHQVDVSSFLLATTPVTVGMWREYLRFNNQLSMPEAPEWDWNDDHPMVNVSWNDIMGLDGTGGYCAWASRVTSKRLSLPTETQYEFTAKEGDRDLKFPWGDAFDKSKVWTHAGQTAKVNRTTRIHINQYGISDLCGNVKEWCFDTRRLYSPPKRDRLGYPLIKTNPTSIGSGPFAKRYRVVRGGSWIDFDPSSFRCAYRGTWNDPIYSHYFIGFRLAARF